MKSIIDTRTASIFAIGLLLVGTINHVVQKDLLGLFPEFELTSVFIMAIPGMLILLLPYILRGKYQPVFGDNRGKSKGMERLELKTVLISCVALLGMILLLDYTGLLPQFHLGSAAYTLAMGGVFFVILSISGNIRAGRRRSAHSTPVAETDN